MTDKKINWPPRDDFRCQTCHARTRHLSYSPSLDVCHCKICSAVSVMSVEDLARHFRAIETRLQALEAIDD